jgi:hypothetical protein
MIQRSRSAHGGIGWTASVSADVSHFSVLPAPTRQAHLLGVHAQRAGELKRKATTPGQSGSNICPRFTSPLGAPFRPGGLTGGYGQQQQYQYQPQQHQKFQRSAQQFQCPGPQTPCPAYPLPSDDSSWHVHEAQCTSHPRRQQLL